MESTSVPGRIQVSEVVHALLSEASEGEAGPSYIGSFAPTGGVQVSGYDVIHCTERSHPGHCITFRALKS